MTTGDVPVTREDWQALRPVIVSALDFARIRAADPDFPGACSRIGAR